jgi:hypothetical protein
VQRTGPCSYLALANGAKFVFDSIVVVPAAVRDVEEGAGRTGRSAGAMSTAVKDSAGGAAQAPSQCRFDLLGPPNVQIETSPSGICALTSSVISGLPSGWGDTTHCHMSRFSR